jgi:UDP-glucose 4-epimerase
MSVYGNVPSAHGPVREEHDCIPVSYYGGNKLASERLIRIFSKVAGMNSTIFRLFNVYGPGQNMRNMKQGMVSIYLSYLMKNKPVLVKGSLSRFRDFIYVDDVTEACLRSLDARTTFGGTFNLGTSRKTAVKALLDLLLKVYDKKDARKWVLVQGNTAGDVTGLTANISRLKKALGWGPEVGLQDGIGRMKEWLDVSAKFWKG